MWGDIRAFYSLITFSCCSSKLLFFYLAPFISNTFNIFLKIQMNVLFLHRKYISPNIITWWFLSRCSTSFASYQVISESNMPGLCLLLKSDSSFVLFYLYKERPGNKWEAQCFSCNLGFLYGPWVSKLWERSQAVAHSGSEAEEQQYMESNNGRNRHALFKVSTTFVNATCEFRSEWNQVWKLKFRTLRYFCYCVRMLRNPKFYRVLKLAIQQSAGL